MVRHTGKNFVNVECIAIPSVLSLQSPRINGSELDTPEAVRLAADDDSAFSEQNFDIAMAQVESKIDPYCIADYIRREPVTFICIHLPILSTLSS